MAAWQLFQQWYNRKEAESNKAKVEALIAMEDSDKRATQVENEMKGVNHDNIEVCNQQMLDYLREQKEHKNE